MLHWIIGVAFGLTVFTVTVFLYAGPGPVVIVLPWFVPAVHSFVGLAAVGIAFLSFGRYQVLRQPAPFWIGVAFSSFAVFVVFYVLSFQGLLPDNRGLVSDMPNTAGWFYHLQFSALVIFLLVAVFARWPQARAAGEIWWFWFVLVGIIAFFLMGWLSLLEEHLLPFLVEDGYFTFLNKAWNAILGVLFLLTAFLSARRYRKTGDSLFGYVALAEIQFGFAIFTGILGGKFYDLWWYWQRALWIGGVSVLLFGLLSEYIDLFRREQERSRELEELHLVTDPGLARQGLEILLRTLLQRIVTIMAADFGAILLIDSAKNEMVPRCVVGLADEQSSCFVENVSQSFSGLTAARNTVFWVRDAEVDQDGWKSHIKEHPFKGFIGAPMCIGEDTIGMVQVGFLVSQEFSPHDERLLEAVAERAALAIHHARLLEETQRREAELKATINNMVDAVYVCDLGGRITLANESGIRQFGLSGIEEVKRNLEELPELLKVRHRDGHPFMTQEMPIARALKGETTRLEDEIIFNQETRRDVFLKTSAAPIKEEGGNIVGAVAVSRDVTELMELDNLKDQFLTVAAHELKTPVTGIKGYAQLLLQWEHEGISPRGAKALRAVNRLTNRISSLINELLKISQLQLGHLELKAERINFTEFVMQAAEQASLTTTKHQVRVIAVDPATIDGDREYLGEVMTNLLDNAIRYSPEGGDIDVSLLVKDHEVIVSVRDHGIGIPDDKQEHIFERFYRAHTGTPYDYGGMGVGLYISKEIVNRHGGRIWFESEEGKGSTFYCSLPFQ